MSKQKLVIFEGGDKTGKDSLYEAYRIATLWGPLCIVRFTGSNIVHDAHYGRKDRDPLALLELEEKLEDLFDVYLIVLWGQSVEKLEERILEYDPPHQKEKALANVRDMNQRFYNYGTEVSRFKKRLILDTTGYTLDQCLEHILRFTNERRRSENWRTQVESLPQ